MTTHTSSPIRTRFAPSPTGFMHIGNVRIALLNALFARQQKGSFLLRIEDTDASRLIDPEGKKILADLTWLQIRFDEGPFYQSQRTAIYQEHLEFLKKKDLVYRCFETAEELEEKRQRQIKLGLPPRYDGTGLRLSTTEVDSLLARKVPFIWRFKLPEGTVTFTELARGPITFDMSHFSDFALTRHDGSFTFLFANCIDDLVMKVSHVIRGADHQTNTASQVALLNAFGATPPIYYHAPLLCNADGKKLSKRDFGFSLDDIRESGFIPEAILNYLGIIGGTYENEILDFEELTTAIDFHKLHQSNTLRYDIDKLRWVNHEWLKRLSLTDLAKRIRPFLEQAYPEAKKLSDKELERCIDPIRAELVTLSDAVNLLAVCFTLPEQTAEMVAAIEPYRTIIEGFIKQGVAKLSAQECIAYFRTEAKAHSFSFADLVSTLRLVLTGSRQGIGIAVLFELMGQERIAQHLQKMLTY